MRAVRGTSSLYAGALPADWNDELPGSTIELILEFEGAWDLEIDGRATRVGAFAAGLVAGTARTRAVGPVRLVQLSVDPFAVPALLGVPAGALSAAAFALTDVAGRPAAELLERLAGLPDDAVARAAERWAQTTVDRAVADRGPLVPADVQRAVGLIRSSGGTMRVEAIASALGCSRRHLARRFQEWVGVRPSELSRLVRFERACGALRERPTQPLGPLAAGSGFADHAHMVREFHALAGAAPSTVAARFL